MNGLYLVILLFILVISRKISRELYNPVFFFVGFWTLLIYLSSLNLYHQNEVSPHTYNCVFLGVISFAVGGFFISLMNVKRHRNSPNQIMSSNKLSNYVYFVSVGICLVLSIYMLRSMSLFFSGNSLDYIRSNFTTVVIHSNLERLLWTFAIFPIGLAAMTISLYAYFIEENKKFLPISLVLTTCIALTNGGRVYFLFFLLLFVYFSLVSRKVFRKRNVIIFLILLYVSYSITYFITTARQIEQSTFESLYVYFTGCFPFMESKMNQIDTMGFHSYGLAFFNAPLTFIEMLLSNLGLMDYSSLLMKTNDFINSFQEYENIGSANFNAFVSIFFTFYMDAGIPGVIIESFLFGCFASYLFYKVKYNRDPLSIGLYSVLINVIFISFVRWQLGRLEFFLSFVYLWLFFSRKRFHSISNKI